MVAIFFTALITFFISSLFGYVVHYSLHQKWTGNLNRLHMTHHLKLYPPSDYLSDTYRNAGKDNTTKIFAMFAVPLVLLPILLWAVGFLTLPMLITALIVESLMGFLHDYLHDSFHIRNHFLTRIPVVRDIFGYWNHLHYLHHVDMQKNFGIFLFHWDHILRTFWKGPAQ